MRLRWRKYSRGWEEFDRRSIFCKRWNKEPLSAATDFIAELQSSASVRAPASLRNRIHRQNSHNLLDIARAQYIVGKRFPMEIRATWRAYSIFGGEDIKGYPACNGYRGLLIRRKKLVRATIALPVRCLTLPRACVNRFESRRRFNG
jgi:hypothetical protein